MVKRQWDSHEFIGIGFGTLYSSISIIDKDEKIVTIANEDGFRNIPSCVAFTSHDELTGTQAKSQSIRNPRNTITQFRSLLGLEYDSDEVAKHQKEFQFEIVASHQDPTLPVYQVESWPEPEGDSVCVQLSAIDMTSKYLAKMRTTANDYIGSDIRGCVVSEPVHFTRQQNAALLAACKKAGFQEAFTIKEPIAAILSFESQLSQVQDGYIAVLDFGGHNFNVTLVKRSRGLYTIVESRDDLKLGGVQLDEVVVKIVAEEFKRKTKMNVFEYKRSVAKLRQMSEQTKRALSQLDTAPCSVESLCEGVDYHGFVNRGKFEALAEPLFQKCDQLIKTTLTSAGLTPGDISDVLLVGGSSRVPRFQTVVKNVFSHSKSLILVDSEPDELIARGCCTHAKMICSMGVESYEQAMQDNNISHHVPVLMASVGIADAQGNVCRILSKNTPIPAKRTIGCSNAVENQTEVFLSIYEGEGLVASENKHIADVLISDLPEGLKVGEAQLEISFLIESDQVLQVHCKECKTAKLSKVKLIK